MMLNVSTLCFLADTNDIIFHLMVLKSLRRKQSHQHGDVIELLTKQVAGHLYSSPPVLLLGVE